MIKYNVLLILAFLPSIVFAQNKNLKSMHSDSLAQAYSLDKIYENSSQSDFESYCIIAMYYAACHKLSTDFSVCDMVEAVTDKDIHVLNDTVFRSTFINESKRMKLENNGKLGTNLWVEDSLICSTFIHFECDSLQYITSPYLYPLLLGREFVAAYRDLEEIGFPYKVARRFISDIDSTLNRNIQFSDNTCKIRHHLFEYVDTLGLRKICFCKNNVPYADSCSISDVCKRYCKEYGFNRLCFDTYLTQGDGIFVSKGIYSDINELEFPYTVCKCLFADDVDTYVVNDKCDKRVYDILGIDPEEYYIVGYLKLDKYYMIISSERLNFDKTIHVVDFNGNKIAELSIGSTSYIIHKNGKICAGLRKKQDSDTYFVSPSGKIVKRNRL